MISSASLTKDASGAHKRLATDIASRIGQSPDLTSFVEGEYQAARDATRSALSESQFRAALVDQAASSWVLSCVLVRFCEDTGLIAEPAISGPGMADQRARDALTLHYRAHPEHSERQYLEHVFRSLSDLPGLGGLLDPAHQLLYVLGPSADGAKALIEFFRKRDPATGDLVHDFSDPERDTRFLGDLYQDLSVDARKRYALLQTPGFVESFILDRTLEPAIKEFGLENASLIDPACGSGHFLLGAFQRLFAHWTAKEPHTEPRLLAQRCLDQIAGIDLNPIAVAIAHVRLLVAALSAARARTLREAPDFRVQIAAADSLLHGPRPGQMPGGEGEPVRRHHYRAEDIPLATALLSRTYAAVVGNPPYITPKDAAENAAYRARFRSCNGKYSVAVPFTERFFDLAHTGPHAGYVGMITANSFMKRDFGTKLVREFIPQWDLTHVIDTSGAYIPGHGTPTVILLARNRRPTSESVRCVLGIRGEPSPPKIAAEGLVWSAIVAQVDEPGSESDFVSVVDTPRERLASHPWSLGGGGAAELKEVIERDSVGDVGGASSSVGITAFTLEDDLFVLPLAVANRRSIPERQVRMMVEGDSVRDWRRAGGDVSVFPYTSQLVPIDLPSEESVHRYLWPARVLIASNRMFGNRTKTEAGLEWFEWGRLTRDKLRTPLSIIFAFVATHNHFVLDRGGKVFKQTAPVIKLPPGSSEDEHLALLGPLNSSAGCFWMKQVFFNKGSTIDQHGARQRTAPFEDFYQHDSTKLARFPLPPDPPTDLARTLDGLAQSVSAATPASVCERQTPTREALDEARANWHSLRAQMIFWQEELDWRCYRLYGITDDELTHQGDPLEIAFGERAFEIVLGQRIAAGDLETAWFTRHRAEPITQIPDSWPADYRALIERRIAAIESSTDIALIERPEHKRRWAHGPWAEQETKALRLWLLDRMEQPQFWTSEPAQLQSIARLSDRLRDDPDFTSVLALYLNRSDYELTKAVADLAKDEAVSYLAALRYTDAGMTKRAEWEEVWDLQRQEDEGQQVGTITPPPRYAKTDFRVGSYWSLRGKLDVPKERFTSYPGLEREADPSLVLGWAGWDHRQRAIALASALTEAQDSGASAERLAPLLAGLAELVPWLVQWHNEPDAQGTRFGDFVASLLSERTARAGLTGEGLAAWRPKGR